MKVCGAFVFACLCVCERACVFEIERGGMGCSSSEKNKLWEGLVNE